MAGGGASEAETLRKRIAEAGMPDEIREKALKELARMQAMPSFSPELSYIRGYIDWLIAMPWSVRDTDEIGLRKAKRVLDEDHFGLEKVKERILDFLAVQKLAGKTRGSILCFVGPPGTGKTSIGKSIARAMGRKFYRMSLGGLRDESEIRGHRRTYVGALPGRILHTLVGYEPNPSGMQMVFYAITLALILFLAEMVKRQQTAQQQAVPVAQA